MLHRKSNHLATVLGVMLGLMISYQGYEAYKAMGQKAEQQVKLLQGFREWRDTYVSLAPVQASWTSSFPEVSSVEDLYGIHKLLAQFGEVDADSIQVTQLARVKQGEVGLGLTRICLSGKGTPGIEIRNATMTALLDSMTKLAASPAIEFGKVVVRAEDNAAVASLQNLCVLVRDAQAPTAVAPAAAVNP